MTKQEHLDAAVRAELEGDDHAADHHYEAAREACTEPSGHSWAHPDDERLAIYCSHCGADGCA